MCTLYKVVHVHLWLTQLTEKMVLVMFVFNMSKPRQWRPMQFGEQTEDLVLRSLPAVQAQAI